MFKKYSFEVKHIITNYKKNTDLKSKSDEEENFMGLTYNFTTDEIRPNIEIHLCKKKRGSYTDEKLNNETVENAPMTTRTLLSTLAQLFDASGRHLNPAQMTGRIIYSRLCKAKLSWDEDIKNFSEDLDEDCRKWLRELVQIDKHLLPISRAWIPENCHPTALHIPCDGSEFGYSTIAYVKSTDGQSTFSNNSSAKSKIAKQSVPENELASQLLGTKLAFKLVENSDVFCNVNFTINFITDSTCSTYLFDPKKIIKDRKKRNVVQKILKNYNKIIGMNSRITINLLWTQGNNNPADLNSKSHKNLVTILNGQKWQNGMKEYASKQPLSSHSKYTLVYCQNADGNKYNPLPTKCIDVACFSCNNVNEERIPDQNDSLSPISTPFKNLTLNAHHTMTPEFYSQVTRNSTSLRNLLHKLEKCKGILSSKKGNYPKDKWYDNNLKNEVFKIILKTSQKLFPPKNIVQLQPSLKEGILMTSNRLSELVHLKYYKNIELPIISHEDKELTRLILSNSHTFRVGLGINPIHLTKKLTNINTKKTPIWCLHY